jgi:hypothetical protein
MLKICDDDHSSAITSDNMDGVRFSADIGPMYKSEVNMKR